MHINEISKHVAKGYHAIVLLDQAGWHTTENLKIPSNISFLPIPPYSPELNPMEQVWQQLRKIKLSNTCYGSYEEILDSCCEAWNTFVSEEDNIRNLCTRIWAK